MAIAPFTAREVFLLAVVVIELALLVLAILRAQKVSQELKRAKNKQHKPRAKPRNRAKVKRHKAIKIEPTLSRMK
jgi:uncharacterized membrane protein affecting hemolysin expression